MATQAILGPAGGTTVDLLDATKHVLQYRTLEPRPNWLDTIVQATRRHDAKVVYSQATHMELLGMIDCRGTTVDQVLAHLNEIETVCQQARDYSSKRKGAQVQLTYGVSGATNPVVFDVLSGKILPPKNYAIQEITNLHLPNCPILLVCRPFGRYVNAVTVDSGELNSYLSWTPAAIVGTMPVPVSVHAANPSNEEPYNFIRVAAVRNTKPGSNLANMIFEYLTGKQVAATGYTVTLNNGAARTGQIDILVRVRDEGVAAKLQVMYRASSGTGGPHSDGTYEVGPEILTDGTATYASFTRTAYVNPVTHKAWTPTYINTLDGWYVKKIGTDALRVSYMTVTVHWPDRNLADQTAVLTSNADGSTVAWAITGGANTHTVLASNDGDTSYIRSVTNGQLSGIKMTTYTEAGAADSGIRAMHAQLVEPFRLDGTDRWTITGDSARGTTNILTGDSDITSGNAGGGASTTCACVGLARYRFRAWFGILTSFSGALNSATVTSDGTNPTTITFNPFAPAVLPSTVKIIGESPGIVGPKTYRGFTGVITVPGDATKITLSFSFTSGTGFDCGGWFLTRDDDPANELAIFAITANPMDNLGHFVGYARARATGEPMQLQVRYGGPDGTAAQVNKYATIPVGSTVSAVRLGQVDIPEDEWSSEITIGGYSWSLWKGNSPGMDFIFTNAWLDIDTVTLWPTDEGLYMEITPVAGSSGVQVGEMAVFDPTGQHTQRYKASIASVIRVGSIKIVGSPFDLTPDTYRVFFAFSRAKDNDVLGDTGQITFTYWPRVAWQRGS